MMTAIKLILGAALLLGASSGAAYAQNCTGVPSANQVCAGPASGSPGFGRFRPLVSADLGSGTYTAPGTGAVAETIPARLSNELWAKDFGAVCDGTTDDHVAFQNMINAGQFPNNLAGHFTGQCAINTGLSITGSYGLYGSTQETAILRIAAAIDGISISSANYVQLRNFGIFGPNAHCNDSNGSTGIRLTSSQQAILEGLLVNCTPNGIILTGSGTFTIANTQIAGNPSASTKIGILMNSTGGVGAVDGTIYGSFINGGHSSSVSVECLSCAGLRFINNKINGASAYGVLINSTAEADGDLFIIGNSIEGISAVGVNITRSDTTSFFGDFVITGNELSGTQCLVIPTDATGPWILGVTISGNLCNAANTTAAFSIDSVFGLTLSANQSWVSGSVASARIGSSVNYAVLGPNGCIASPTSNANKYTGASACAASSNSATNSTVISPY